MEESHALGESNSGHAAIISGFLPSLHVCTATQNPSVKLTSIWQQSRHFILIQSKHRQALGGTARMISCAVCYESEVY